LEASQHKQRLKRKFLSIYASTAFGYYLLADGTTISSTHHHRGSDTRPLRLRVQLRDAIFQSGPGYTLEVLKPLKEDSEFETNGDRAVVICVHDDPACAGEACKRSLQDAYEDHATGQGETRAGIRR
jgi:hypothetical protein